MHIQCAECTASVGQKRRQDGCGGGSQLPRHVFRTENAVSPVKFILFVYVARLIQPSNKGRSLHEEGAPVAERVSR